MSKRALYALVWSEGHHCYDLYTAGQFYQCFRQGEEQGWQSWLSEHTSFSFQGQHGHLSVIKEFRAGGNGYWYAYSTRDRHRSKRYLGRTAQLSLQRLEEEARELASLHVSPGPGSLLRLKADTHTVPFSSDRIWSQMPLLTSKLSPPRLPATLIQREELHVILDTALFHRLTLLSAAAGWGKTTLLCAWVAQAPLPIAWLSLDELDNIPTRFWASVIAALHTAHPGVGETALALLRSAEPPDLLVSLTALLNELNKLPQQTVFILEDYHLVADPAIHASVIFFLDHLPLHLHLVLSSRVDPPFPLSRWRMQRQLLEIRAADLRFRQQEATRFLKETMGLPLSQEEITTLEHRTEGWIAGLHLAALALQKPENRSHFVQIFGGRYHYLLDYVQQEILAHLPQVLQDFLLQIAILDRLNAALCRAVTEELTSQKFLETIERANLFLIPLDEERCWYRFHDLFREALLARLHAHWPERVPELHSRAACWYEAQGYIHEAVTHALAASDYPLAASIIERGAESLWLGGEASTVFTWTMSLSDTTLSKHASFALNAALRLLESIYWSTEAFRISMQDLALQGLARIETLLHQQQELVLPLDEQKLVLRRLHLLRVWIASREMVWQIDREGVQHLVQQMQELAQEDEMNWKMIPFYLEITLISLLKREGALLIPLILEAKEQASLMRNHLITLSLMRQLAAVYARAEQLHQTYQECLAGLSLAEQIGAQTPATGYLYYYLAWVYSDWNRQEEAKHAIQQMLHISQLFQQKDMLIAGAAFSSQLSLEAGDLTAAEQTLHLAEELVQGQEKAAHLFWVTATRVRYWLATGNLEAACDWAAHMVFELQAWDSIQIGSFLALIRVYLAQRQYRQAMALLQRFRTKFDRPGDISTTIEFLALQVVCLYLLKKAAEAQKVAAHLLHLTEPHGNIRIYVHAGEPMKLVLASLLKAQRDGETACSGISTAYIYTLLRAFEQEQSPGVPASQQPQQLAPKTWSLPLDMLACLPLVEPLSEQEQQILRLLALGHTNAEIASLMVISLNTVKTHVQHIYQKLGIHNRVQACHLGRHLLLL